MDVSGILINSRQLIARGKTGDAIKCLLSLLESNDLDKQIIDSLLLVSSHFNSLRHKNIIGIISNSDFQVESAQISHALLEIINDVEELSLNLEKNFGKKTYRTQGYSNSSQVIINGNISDSNIIIGNENKVRTQKREK